MMVSYFLTRSVIHYNYSKECLYPRHAYNQGRPITKPVIHSVIHYGLRGGGECTKDRKGKVIEEEASVLRERLLLLLLPIRLIMARFYPRIRLYYILF